VLAVVLLRRREVLDELAGQAGHDHPLEAGALPDRGPDARAHLGRGLRKGKPIMA
jgi:hypothetical protein